MAMGGSRVTPISTALPPPTVEVVDSWYYPNRNVGDGVGAAIGFGGGAVQRNATVQATIAFGTYGASGGSGSTTELVGTAQVNQPDGRQESMRVVTTVTANGQGVKPPFQKESYGPAADWAPGAQQPPSNVVSVVGVTFQNSDEVANWPDDTTGFSFSPNTGVITDNLRPGSLPFSGFGMFFNDDGGGGVELEYVSWLGAATVERVPLTAGLVTDYSQWNSIRFITVSAAGGREAFVTIEVNSTRFLIRNFGSGGSPDIPFPSAISATALHYVFGAVARLGGGAFYSFYAYGYDGRFTPSGEELQVFG